MREKNKTTYKCTKGSIAKRAIYIPDKRDKEVTMTRQRIHGMYLVCFNYSYNLSTQALKNYNEIHILL